MKIGVVDGTNCAVNTQYEADIVIKDMLKIVSYS
jgi:hypothetical protein